MHTKQTLGEIVTRNPATARVFQARGMDFCCGGHQTLDEAILDAGVEKESVLEELERVTTERNHDLLGWDDRPLPELIDYIVDRYHADARVEIPLLIDLAHKVEKAHADKDSCPHGLASILEGMLGEVESHLRKEEEILFPLIKSGRGAVAHSPVRVMMLEHEGVGEVLRSIRKLTDDFSVPAEGCHSWRSLYNRLEILENDFMEHIHLENNVLFPRALRQDISSVRN